MPSIINKNVEILINGNILLIEAIGNRGQIYKGV